MVQARWLLVVALATVLPLDQALAVRVERRPGSTVAQAAPPARTARVTRWRDSARTEPRPRPTGRVGRELRRTATVRGPVGIVRGGGTERVAGGREPAEAARVGLQIERTRRMLDLVRERAERCGSVPAREAVRRATEMQDRAESAERSGRHLGALQLTREAREQGVAALRHCGHAAHSSEGAASALGRTDELLTLERERRSVRPSAPADDRAGALERAAAAQRRAHDEFRNGRLESSLRLTHEARQSLRQGARAQTGTWRDGTQRRDAASRDARRPDTRREATRRSRPPRD